MTPKLKRRTDKSFGQQTLGSVRLGSADGSFHGVSNPATRGALPEIARTEETFTVTVAATYAAGGSVIAPAVAKRRDMYADSLVGPRSSLGT